MSIKMKEGEKTLAGKYWRHIFVTVFISSAGVKFQIGHNFSFFFTKFIDNNNNNNNNNNDDDNNNIKL